MKFVKLLVIFRTVFILQLMLLVNWVEIINDCEITLLLCCRDGYCKLNKDFAYGTKTKSTLASKELVTNHLIFWDLWGTALNICSCLKKLEGNMSSLSIPTVYWLRQCGAKVEVISKTKKLQACWDLVESFQISPNQLEGKLQKFLQAFSLEEESDDFTFIH